MTDNISDDFPPARSSACLDGKGDSEHASTQKVHYLRSGHAGFDKMKTRMFWRECRKETTCFWWGKESKKHAKREKDSRWQTFHNILRWISVQECQADIEITVFSGQILQKVSMSGDDILKKGGVKKRDTFARRTNLGDL
jgi:hypothetical protein